MALEDNAPLAYLDSEETQLSDESESEDCGAATGGTQDQTFTLNDYFCTYIDNSATCSLLNTPQPAPRRPVTPVLFEAPSDDEAKLGGSLSDLVTSFDSTIRQFSKHQSDDQNEPPGASGGCEVARKKNLRSKRTLWWSLTGELPRSNQDDSGEATGDGSEAAESVNESENDAVSSAGHRGSTDGNGEVHSNECADEVLKARELSETVDQVINEIECMFDEQAAIMEVSAFFGRLNRVADLLGCVRLIGSPNE